MRIDFTVTEIFMTTNIRYKYYDVPDGLSFPKEWDDWTTDEKYGWVNNNCIFDHDFAEELDRECTKDFAVEMSVHQ